MSEAAAQSRFAIRRVVLRVAYAQNGNLHNPSREYLWQSLVDGQVVGVDHRLGAARNFLREYYGAGDSIEVIRDPA